MLTRMRFLFLVLVLVPFHARVVRTEITSRNDILQGRQFGNTGAYERITGRVYFLVKVGDSHNKGIVDLDKAETVKDGQVEFSSDFVAIQPKDAARRNGSTLLEIPNRGSSRILATSGWRRLGSPQRPRRWMAAQEWIQLRRARVAMGRAR